MSLLPLLVFPHQDTRVSSRRKRIRRRGKPLVSGPYIEELDDRNDQFRCKVKREQPFRSASSDAGQVCCRNNMDFQFLSCAPQDLDHAAEDVEAPEPSDSAAGDGAIPCGGGMRGAKRKRTETYEWLYGTQHKRLERGLRWKFAQSFSAAPFKSNIRLTFTSRSIKASTWKL